MNTGPVRIERRATQRFDFNLPISVRLAGSKQEGCGFTQDLSARGVLFYTDFPLSAGDAVELTLLMPSEITLAETMRVRCRGKVMRVLPPGGGSTCGVAVHLEGYEFLPEPDSLASSAGAFERVQGLHADHQEKETAEGTSRRFHPRTAVLP
jgi:hypothetical protein